MALSPPPHLHSGHQPTPQGSAFPPPNKPWEDLEGSEEMNLYTDGLGNTFDSYQDEGHASPISAVNAKGVAAGSSVLNTSTFHPSMHRSSRSTSVASARSLALAASSDEEDRSPAPSRSANDSFFILSSPTLCSRLSVASAKQYQASVPEPSMMHQTMSQNIASAVLSKDGLRQRLGLLRPFCQRVVKSRTQAVSMDTMASIINRFYTLTPMNGVASW
jgi:hypothetical protein